jgi:hypothetical protein
MSKTRTLRKIRCGNVLCRFGKTKRIRALRISIITLFFSPVFFLWRQEKTHDMIAWAGSDVSVEECVFLGRLGGNTHNKSLVVLFENFESFSESFRSFSFSFLNWELDNVRL